MNIEEIDKWLNDNEGMSYTELDKLLESVENRKDKLQDKVNNLQQRIDKANELLSKIVVCEREDGNWGAVKNTSKQDVYKTIWKLYEILDTSSYERNEMLKILGDKE